MLNVNELTFNELLHAVHVADVLQESLVVSSLPSIPNIRLASCYRPAGDGRGVGGDFYDVFPISQDKWAFVIGDVCGKGSEAAALTALSRYTIRAAAMKTELPSEMLTFLNEAVLRQHPERYCTVVCGTVRFGDAGAALTISCGGHPPPVVVSRTGVVEPAAPYGPAIGILADSTFSDTERTLWYGEKLVLFTDGVTEARRDGVLMGEQRLYAELSKLHRADAQATVEAVDLAIHTFSRGARADDVAVLVLESIDESLRMFEKAS